MERFVYVDNAATTPLSDSVLAAMQPYFKEKYGNASSIYKIGQDSRKAIENARDQVANTSQAIQ